MPGALSAGHSAMSVELQGLTGPRTDVGAGVGQGQGEEKINNQERRATGGIDATTANVPRNPGDGRTSDSEIGTKRAPVRCCVLRVRSQG